jgi:hypothetical protein
MTPPPTPPTPILTLTNPGAGYTHLPARTLSQSAQDTAAPRDKDFEKVIRQLLAQTFYGPMLKQMHDSPFKSELFSGGRGGEAFNELLDQQLITHAAGTESGSGGRLAKSIARQYHTLHPQNPTTDPNDPNTADHASNSAPATRPARFKGVIHGHVNPSFLQPTTAPSNSHELSVLG